MPARRGDFLTGERCGLAHMPQIVTSHSPMLAAAQVNSQVEFDRAFRSIAREPAYEGKRLLYISGLHIDVSPEQGQIFPQTKFVPWAAYFQDTDHSHRTFEQDPLWNLLEEQSLENPDQIDMDTALQQMEGLNEVTVNGMNG